MRRTIARRMSEGVHHAAPVTLTTRADATQLVRRRESFKTSAANSPKAAPTFTDILAKLTAAALQQHPLLNAQWRDDGVFIPDDINIAIAVDTEDGLLAPVLRDVARLTLEQVAAASRSLVEQARARRLTPGQLQGGTFTLTNLGSLGVDAFTPILNLPQCATLGVGRIQREPVVAGAEIVIRERFTLSLTFDHRIVDGAPAARFLQTLRAFIESPEPYATLASRTATESNWESGKGG
jgi:pyruvate dehydrogenase E2 component (dihydrolipoamide acetyltransferase)